MAAVHSKNIAQDIIQSWQQKKLAAINYHTPVHQPKPERKTDSYTPAKKPPENKIPFYRTPGGLLLITTLAAGLLILLMKWRKVGSKTEVLNKTEQIENEAEKKVTEVLKPEQIKNNIETVLRIEMPNKTVEKVIERDKNMLKKNGFYIFDRVFNKTENAESFRGSRRADYMVLEFWKLAEEALRRGDLIEAEQHLYNSLKMGSNLIMKNTDIMNKLKELYKVHPTTEFKYRYSLSDLKKWAEELDLREKAKKFLDES